MAAAIALLLASGCKPEVGRVIWLIGDSTAAETLEELHLAAAGRDRGDVVIPIAAIPSSALGRDLEYFTQRIASAHMPPTRITTPAAIVVSLGSNDTRDGRPPLESWPLVDTPEKLAFAIDSLLLALPPGVHVIWVTPGGTVLPRDRVAHVVRELGVATARWPNLELLTPDPAWYTGAGQDGLHFTSDGELALATALVRRLDDISTAAE